MKNLIILLISVGLILGFSGSGFAAEAEYLLKDQGILYMIVDGGKAELVKELPGAITIKGVDYTLKDGKYVEAEEAGSGEYVIDKDGNLYEIVDGKQILVKNPTFPYIQVGDDRFKLVDGRYEIDDGEEEEPGEVPGGVEAKYRWQ